MKILKRFLLLVAIPTVFALVAAGCGGGGGGDGDGGGGDGGGGDGGEQVTYGMIQGTVSDTEGNPIGDVTVTAGDKTLTSNDEGWFSVDNIEETERLVVIFTKQGYCLTSEITTIRPGVSSYLETTMKANEVTETILGDTGGTVSTPDGGSVEIGPDTLVDSSGDPYSGLATVAITTFDPTIEADFNAFPGEFEGVRIGGDTVAFESYGFVDVTITDEGGNPLQLAGGETATIEIPIPLYLLANVQLPDKVPFWFFNKTDGRWYEEGESTMVGDVYQCEVRHFSPWNIDDPRYWLSRVYGTVVDNRGQPVQGARVTLRGVNFGWSAGESSTGEWGKFSFDAQADSDGMIQASRGEVKSVPSQIHTAKSQMSLDAGEIIIGGVPKARIALTWGPQPEDLDAHLTVPKDTGREHIYWWVQGDLVAGAKLNTDDRDGYGPEIITIYEFEHDGVYRFAVHHYSGIGSISSYGGNIAVHLEVPGSGLYRFTPPAGAIGVGDAWLLCDLVVSNATVESVNSLNTYLHNVASNDIDAFSP
jgi:hypothetical protein